MIHVEVNNNPHQIKANSSLESLLEKLDISTNGIAVAINLHVVGKIHWKTQTLQDGDEILIIKAVLNANTWTLFSN